MADLKQPLVLKWTLKLGDADFSESVTVTDAVDLGPDHPIMKAAIQLLMMQIGERISLELLKCPEDDGGFPKFGGRVRTRVLDKNEYERCLSALSAHAA
jgi:hypothetical protein